MLTIFVNQIWLAANSRGYLRRNSEDSQDEEDEELGYGDEEKEIEHNSCDVVDEKHINNIVDTSTKSKSNFLLIPQLQYKTDDDRAKNMMTTAKISNPDENEDSSTTESSVTHCEYHCQCKRNEVYYYKWTEKDGVRGKIHKSSSSFTSTPSPSFLGLYNVLLGCIVLFCLAMSLLFLHQMGNNDFTLVPTNFREELMQNQDLLKDIVMDILKNVSTSTATLKTTYQKDTTGQT